MRIKLFNLLAVSIIVFITASCSDNNNTITKSDSAKTALEKTLKTIKKGDYKKAIEMMECADIASQSDKDFAERMLNLKYKNLNGLYDWEIVWEDTVEQDKMMAFGVIFHYGTTDEKKSVPMVWTESGWRMRDMLFHVIGRDEFLRKIMEVEYSGKWY